MTRDECKDIRPGMRCLIADDFVEDPYAGLEEFLGTVQTVERVDQSGGGWIYFEDLPQPFAMSEVVCIKHDVDSIDDDTVPYDCGDIGLIFGEV